MTLFLQVNLLYNNSIIHFIPQSQIILDKSICASITLATSTIIPFITPTPVPISSETCTKLKQIAANPMVGTCTTNTRCDTVICSLPGYTSEFQILPCYDPPAFYIVLKDQNNNIVLRKIVTNSSIIQLPSSTLNVTLKHKQNTLRVEVSIHSLHL